MSCSPFDLRDYWFEELPVDEGRQVEAHLSGCAKCREEIERLRATHGVLLRLKDEEMPRRIAFVSDKVFEPSRTARWWAALGQGVPKFALTTALVLAIFFGGAWITRPSLTVERGRWQIACGRSDAQVEQAVTRAVAQVEARQAVERRNLEEAYDLLVKQMNILYRQSDEMRPASLRQ